MALQASEGAVESGMIRLRAGVQLPEHAKVYVIIPDAGLPPGARVWSPRLAHALQAADFAKEVITVPADAGV